MDEQQYLLVPDLAHRLAAIDIGTNSIRLAIVEVLRGGAYRILDEERDSTRLGRALNATRRLDDRAVEASLESLRRMKQIADGFHVRELRCVATCAVREAENGGEFVERARAEAGIEVEVISSEQEARLAFSSVQRAFDLSGKNLALADIGGGSTEIVLASGPVVEAVYTTKLGAVRLAEMFGGGQNLAGEDFERLVKSIDLHLERRTRKPVFLPHLLFGSGGTFTSLAEMMMAAKGQNGLPVRGYLVSRAEVRHLLDRLRKLTPKARRSVPGLSPDRADIIVPGLAIVDRVMRRFGINLVQVHNRGVQDGLLLAMIDQAPEVELTVASLDREAAIDEFAVKCGSDLKHERQVARLAGQIFAQLAAPYRLDPADQPLLEAAARLQDVGYLINYDQHHKHSFHLIVNSRLPGFQPRDLLLVANVARYHRGAEPKRKHDNFKQLAPEDQRRVRKMASILRLAGGLDRSHTQAVRAVLVEQRPGETVLHVEADDLPEVDLWGARRRAEFFESSFKTKLVVEGTVAPKPAEAAGAGENGNGEAGDDSPRPAGRRSRRNASID
jgi:exopolyphosphatase/guanosine-5'-triphosphate,3'-diphosphate pyrophosphatase